MWYQGMRCYRNKCANAYGFYWFTDLAISPIIVDAIDKRGIEFLESTVNIKDIRRKYHKEVEKVFFNN